MEEQKAKNIYRVMINDQKEHFFMKQIELRKV